MIRKKHMFIGILLLSTGLLFLMHQFNLPFAKTFSHWPTILVILGIAILIQTSKESISVLAGWLLLLLGIHFHGLSFFTAWPMHNGMYLLIIGIAFLLTYLSNRREGLIMGILFLLIGAATFYNEEISTIIGPSTWSVILSYFPAFLIVIGVYFLFFKK